MRTIKIFDSKNYEESWKKFKRDSSRAIIYSNNKLVMIRSEKYGEYKFPGGGIERDETQIDALIRETLEETGLHIVPNSISEYGKTLIVRKSFSDNEIFEQESFYYLCDVEAGMNSPIKLDEGYETEYNYRLVYVTIDEAIEANKKLLNIAEIPWVERDLEVLLELNDNIKTISNKVEI